jgi:Phage Mu protein F like protein
LERVLRAAAKVERDLMSLDKRTLRALVADLEAARRSTLDALAAAPNDWQIVHARGVIAELERQLVVWQQRSLATMQAAGEPAAGLGLRLTTDVLDAGGVEFTTVPMLPTSVVSAAFRTLPDLLADVSDDTVLKVGRILRQSVLGQQTPLDAMRAIGTIVGPAKGGPFRNAALRSEFIVRTELGRISQQASVATMRQVADSVGGLQKEWCALLDDHTRPTHAEANGQVVGVDEDFDLGGYAASYPSDPRLPPEESIGCRCMALPSHESWRAVPSIGESERLTSVG